jgi:hypothetical protein
VEISLGEMKQNKNEPTDLQTDGCGQFPNTSWLILHRKHGGQRSKYRVSISVTDGVTRSPVDARYGRRSTGDYGYGPSNAVPSRDTLQPLTVRVFTRSTRP